MQSPDNFERSAKKLGSACTFEHEKIASILAFYGIYT
jgi:hypothetical protein